jgi:hypothetical protein
MKDFIPVPDAELAEWAQALLDYVTTAPASVGLVAADLTPMADAKTAFDGAYDSHVAAQADARAKRQAKDDARVELVDQARALVRRIQAFPGTTDAVRQTLGITVRDAVPSIASAAVLADTRPWATVDTSQRLRHTIDFRDAGTKDRRAKPAGMKGCEIWVRIGTAPVDPPADMQFLALSTATPFIAEYNFADANKTAYYMLRWVNTRDEKGPWSETVEATIVG